MGAITEFLRQAPDEFSRGRIIDPVDDIMNEYKMAVGQ